jgi:hypothetical protein
MRYLTFLATDTTVWILILMLAGIVGTILYLALTSITQSRGVDRHSRHRDTRR